MLPPSHLITALTELWPIFASQVFASADKFDEWFNMGDAKNKEAEAEVVQQLHKARNGPAVEQVCRRPHPQWERWLTLASDQGTPSSRSNLYMVA